MPRTKCDCRHFSLTESLLSNSNGKENTPLFGPQAEAKSGILQRPSCVAFVLVRTRNIDRGSIQPGLDVRDQTSSPTTDHEPA
jgi:hypothetical protein